VSKRLKSYRGHSTRPRYTRYDLSSYKTYLAVENEVDELLEQWPRDATRTVALLAVQEDYYLSGGVHWAVEDVAAEDKVNADGKAMWYRKAMRGRDPERLARYERHQALAQAALVERKRRKQGPPTGKVPRRQSRPGGPKTVLIPRGRL